MASSNLYADKILKEHPVAVYPLDDKIDYYSFLQESDRKMYHTSIMQYPNKIWTITGGAPAAYPAYQSDDPLYISRPFTSSFFSNIENISTDNTVSFKSKNLLETDYPQDIQPISIIDYEKATVSVGGYFAVVGTIESNTKIELGYQLGNVSKTKAVTIKEANAWVYISVTLDLDDSDLQATELYLKFNFIDLASGSERILTNGLTFGQDCEEYSATSLGIDYYQITNTSIAGYAVSNLPDTFPFSAINQSKTSIFALESEPLGLVSDSKETSSNAFYLIDRSPKLLAKNSGIPMVYGSKNITTITNSLLDDTQTKNTPSLVIPGSGFLHSSGKTTTTSVEFWLRVNSKASVPRKIFGPLESSDGLYVDGPFIVLKIGKYYGSHYVGEWYRPMLINISYSPKSSLLMINGKEVVYLNFEYDENSDTNDLFFPSSVYGTDINNNKILTYDTDWLGFYCYSDISQIDIDCFAIYSYEVPSIIAKKRWVYGQAVLFPEQIISDNGGSPAVIDYSVAKYANNYNFPDQGKWEDGILDNVSVVNDMLCSQLLQELPTFYFDTKTEEDWYKDIESYNFPGIKLRPNDNWNEVNGYMFFERMSDSKEIINSLYGVFQLPLDFYGEQILFKIIDQRTNAYFKISVKADDISTPAYIDYVFYYGFMDGSVTFTPLDESENPSSIVPRGHNFHVGIDMQELATNPYTSGIFSDFFGNRQRLKVYVGGDSSFTNTFTGHIHNISFANKKNTEDIFSNDQSSTSDGIFNLDSVEYDGGYYNTEEWQYAIDGGSPTTIYQYNDSAVLESFQGQDIYLIDGGSYETSEWEDSLDAGTYETSNWMGVYDMGGPEPLYRPNEYNKNFLDRYATYSLFRKSYLGIYELQIASQSYWEDYIPLKLLAKALPEGYLLSYGQFNFNYPRPNASYEGIYDTSNSSIKTFLSFQDLSYDRIQSFDNSIKASSSNLIDNFGDLSNTRFEVVDGTVFKNPGLNLENSAVVVHVEMKTDNAIKRPIKIKSMQLSGQALIENERNPIGTKFGQDIYTYSTENSDRYIPGNSYFSIYKQTTPHLYLTKNSGITVVGTKTGSYKHGIAFPLNANKETDFYLSAVNFSARNDKETFTELRNLFAQIDYFGDSIDFYIETLSFKHDRVKLSAIKRSTGEEFTGITYYLNGNKVKDVFLNSQEWNNIGIIFDSPLDMTDASSEYRFVIIEPITINNFVSYKDLPNVDKNKTADLTKFYGVSPEEINGFTNKMRKIIVKDSRRLWFKNYQKAYYDDISFTTKTVTPL